MSQSERIASLLASNITPTQVASMLGVSPARISQIAATEEFKVLLAAKQAELSASNVEEETITAKYNTAEHILLNQIMDLAPISELRDVTAALRVVAERQDRAKQRVAPIFQGNIINQQHIVQLTIPSHAVPEIHISQNQEVLAIGDKNLAPMTSAGVTALFQALKGEHHVQDRTAIEASSLAKEALPGPATSPGLNYAEQF